jgi:hypothetical protein
VFPADKGEPVQQKADQKDQRRAPEYPPQSRGSVLLFEAGHDKAERVAYGKKEEGKYQIGWSEAVPRSMIEGPIGLSGLVVDKDHECNSGASEYVQGIISFFHRDIIIFQRSNGTFRFQVLTPIVKAADENKII